MQRIWPEELALQQLRQAIWLMVVYTLNIRGGGGMPLYTGVGGAVKEMKDLSIGTGGDNKKS